MKFDDSYHKFMRRLVHDDNATIFYEEKTTISDLLCESILQSPYRLIEDIIGKLRQGIHEFSYSKEDILSLSDRHWKFYNDAEKLPSNFRLDIYEASEEEQRQKTGKPIPFHCSMMEIGDEDNLWHETIWINTDDKANAQYDEGFKNLLKHELGHAWTFLFGMQDEAFTVGQGPANEKAFCVEKLNEYQKDVLVSLYGGRVDLLKNDYEYILQRQGGDSAAFELPVHIDEIIEILVADYLESWHKSTESYLRDIWMKLSQDRIGQRMSFNLLSHFKDGSLYEGYSTIEAVKNPIRRLFLLFAFGTDEQINYFKEACEEEFGKLE